MSSNLTGWADKLRARGMMERFRENRSEEMLYRWAHTSDEEKTRRTRPMLAALRKIRPLVSREEALIRKRERSKRDYRLRVGEAAKTHPWNDAEIARLDQLRARRH